MWKRYTLVFLTIVLIGIANTQITNAQTTCLDAQPTQFAVGMHGTGATNSLDLFDQASKHGKIQGNLQRGERFTVTGGPTCNEGSFWWQIATEHGGKGWVAEADSEHYLVAPITREIRRFGHGTARALSWSPDSKMLAVGGSLGIWLYTNTLQPIRLLPAYDDGVLSIAWSPDGKKIASANGDKTVQLWDVTTGQTQTLLRRESRDKEAAYWNGSVTWSPDSTKFASAGLEKAVRIWDAQSGKLLATLQHNGPVYSVAWHPDGKRLASGGKVADGWAGSINIWDVSNLKLLKAYSGKLPYEGSLLDEKIAHVTFVQWNGATHQLGVVTFQHELFDWDVETDETTMINLLAVGGNHSVTFIRSPDGKRFAGVTSGVTWLDEYSSVGFRTVSDAPQAMAWSNDNQVIAIIDGDGAIYLSDGQQINDTHEARRTAPNYDFTSPLGLTWANVDGQKVVIVSIGPHAETVNIDNGKTLAPTATLTPSPTPPEFSPTMTPTPPPYPVSETACCGAMPTTIEVVASSPDGAKDVVLNWSAFLSVYDRATYNKLFDLNIPKRGEGDMTSGYTRADWSPDGKWIAATDQGFLAIWDATNGDLKTYEKVGSDNPSWSPDSKRLLLATPAVMVDLTGKVLLQYDKGVGRWMPDKKRILTHHEASEVFKLWDADTGKLRQTMGGTLVQPGPDSRLWAFGGADQSIQIWDMTNEKLSLILAGLTAPAAIIRWRQDGALLAAASTDRIIRVWNTKTGQLVMTMGGHRAAITSLTWKPDGQQLYSISADNTLRLWDTREP